MHTSGFSLWRNAYLNCGCIRLKRCQGGRELCVLPKWDFLREGDGVGSINGVEELHLLLRRCHYFSLRGPPWVPFPSSSSCKGSPAPRFSGGNSLSGLCVL